MKKMDLPEIFEEHFIAAYLVAVEECDAVAHRVRPFGSLHQLPIAALGHSSQKDSYVGCDVLN